MSSRTRAPAPAIGVDETPQTCRRCDLWRNASQAVTGEGPRRAQIVLVGEQPGDEEDKRGKPFVGPAGRVLDELLEECGIARDDVFITNAVKHFKWEPRGKFRLHKKPSAGEIDACNVWLVQEMTRENPRVAVALGATALRALTGRSTSIESARGAELRYPSGAMIIATYHPSAILRAEDERRTSLRAALSEDLRRAAKYARAHG